MLRWTFSSDRNKYIIISTYVSFFIYCKSVCLKYSIFPQQHYTSTKHTHTRARSRAHTQRKSIVSCHHCCLTFAFNWTCLRMINFVFFPNTTVFQSKIIHPLFRFIDRRYRVISGFSMHCQSCCFETYMLYSFYQFPNTAFYIVYITKSS